MALVHHGDCLAIMSGMESACVDLTVTSPPYDNLRTYKGHTWDFEGIAKELYRVTKPGGVVVWVVGDATVNGSETGSSFYQALFFKECGFNIHDTMIYYREGPPLSHNRYDPKFEFMFVFSRGRPKTFNGIREESLSAGKKRTGSMRQDGDHLSTRNAGGTVQETKLKGNVWEISCGNGGTRDKIAWKHPAIFPESLARDHILSWSNPGDLVFDPFSGSGTTGKMAVQSGRVFVGCEIAEEYVEIARQRISLALNVA